MTFQEAFAEVKDIVSRADVSKYDGGHIVFQVNLRGEGEGAFYVELDNSFVDVQPYEYYDRDVIFTVGTKDFLKIMKGKLDPVLAFTIGKLKVDGDIGKALEIQKLIKS